MALEALQDRREITSNDLTSHGQPWAMADEIAGKLHPKGVREAKQPLVVNTDLSGGPGIHWITLFPMGRKTLIFDPLGPENRRDNDSVIREQIRRTGSEAELMSIRVQAKKSTHCGFFALAAAKLGPDSIPLVFKGIPSGARDAPRIALGNVKQLIRMFGFRE